MLVSSFRKHSQHAEKLHNCHGFQVLNGPLRLPLTILRPCYLFGPCREAHAASPPTMGIALSITITVLAGSPGRANVVSKAGLTRLARVAVCGCSLKIEFEGRETQAAEFWLECDQQWSCSMRLWRSLRFIYHHQRAQALGQPGSKCVDVRGPVNVEFLGYSIQVVQKSHFQFESLILAQNERWRQA
jgi:hypothetical protein